MIGENIKKIITDNGYTVEEFAKKMGVTPPALYDIFKKEDVSTKRLNQISAILGVSVQDIMNYKEKLYKSSINESSDALKKEIEMLRELIKAKDETISILKSKAGLSDDKQSKAS